jgi:hypothetical protein
LIPVTLFGTGVQKLLGHFTNCSGVRTVSSKLNAAGQA